MADLIALLTRLASFPDAEMGAAWDWPGHPEGRGLEIRYIHWQCFQLEAAASSRAPVPAGDAATVMDLAQSAWGDLRGRLAGLDDALLDAPPAAAEDWTLRQLLSHVLVTERRYLRQVRHAVSRADSDPLYLEQPPGLEPGEDAGSVADWIARLEAERATSDAYCRGLDAAALARPTQWVAYDVDVRFRLERFSAHLAEHAIHLDRLLTALGAPAGEARQAARRISALRGLHERRTPPSALAALDADQAALVSSPQRS